MAATPLQKVIMVYLCINIVLFLGGVRVIGEDTSDFLAKYVNVSVDSAGNPSNVAPSNLLENTLPSEFSNPVSTESLTFIDSLGVLQNFVSFIINILFTPLGLFTGAGLNASVVMLIGIPLMTMGFFGLAYFMRSGG